MIFSQRGCLDCFSLPTKAVIKIFELDTVQILYDLQTFILLGFPGGSEVKASACNAGDPGLIPESGRSPGKGHGNPLQYSYLENPHGQRSLAS